MISFHGAKVVTQITIVSDGKSGLCFARRVVWSPPVGLFTAIRVATSYVPSIQLNGQTEKFGAYKFHHKREATDVIAQYSRGVREHLFVEPVIIEKDAIFD